MRAFEDGHGKGKNTEMADILGGDEDFDLDALLVLLEEKYPE